MKIFNRLFLPGLFLLLSLQACQSYRFRSNYKDANDLLYQTQNLKEKPFLKAHLKNGDVCILKDSWKVDTRLNIVSGTGIRYDFNRKETFNGTIDIPIEQVAIFETNKKIVNPEKNRVAGLAVLAVMDVVAALVCLSNPKACFGSCPTFYINEEDNFHYADAEGFSNAISPSMEYGDVDALNSKYIAGDTFSLTMKNEALETHCINDLKLLAFPLDEGERVYQSPSDTYFMCEDAYPLTSAHADEGDITRLLANPDRMERFSFADGKNLKSKEEIILNFEDVEAMEQAGLIVNFRQTLMTTYFIYSAMGYMGDEVGDIFAEFEKNRKTKDKLKNGIQKALGKMDVFLWDEKEENWVFQGGLYETGPIAINRQMVPLNLPVNKGTVKLKLVMNRGLWRLDYVGLASVVRQVEPRPISPAIVIKKGKADELALDKIKQQEEHLYSMPGDKYTFQFLLPCSDSDYELFLYSKGYYLEWMRASWLKEKNLPKLRQMLLRPQKYLKTEAQNYKEYEKTMEEVFWNSKVDAQTISANEK